MNQTRPPRQQFYTAYLVGAVVAFPVAWILVTALQVLIGRTSTAALTQFWGAHLAISAVVGLATFWWVARDTAGILRTALRGAMAVFLFAFAVAGVLGGVMIGLDQMRPGELLASLIDMVAMTLAGGLAGALLSLIVARISESERSSRTRR